jgi:N-acetylglucosamine kinase-like BadF-type ATPase/transcriptional regulator with XRE-family HTH domain
MKRTTLRILSETIEKIRLEKNLSPKDLSRASKISYSTLIPILNGSRDCGTTKLLAIVNALECDPNTLLTGLFQVQKVIENHEKQTSPKSMPKYLVAFISTISVTHCLVLDTISQTKRTTVFQFAFGCAQNPEDFIELVASSVKEIVSKNFSRQINNKDVGVFISVQEYEITINREEIQKSGSSLFSTFILEKDAITNYNALIGNDNAICVTINDGDAITYSTDKGKNIVKLQGYGFPISDEAGHHWIGCEAIRHVINVKEGDESSTSLSDSLLALFNEDINLLSEGIMLDQASTYSRASSVVRELINVDTAAYEIVKKSADLLLKRIKSIDDKTKSKLPIILTGDLATLYSSFFPQKRLIKTKAIHGSLLLNYGVGVLQNNL